MGILKQPIEEWTVEAASELSAGLGVAHPLQGEQDKMLGYLISEAVKCERERCIAALTSVNPMEVSYCDKIHGDGWWEFKVREVLERNA